MKRIFGLLIAVMLILGVSAQAQAGLTLKGTDTVGNRLIYDDDLDITWYDYTNAVNRWQNQVDWADALTVTFDGTDYTDWRLPSTVDGPYVSGTDGTTTVGYNITTSEMGHLYYTELGNLGYRDTSGSLQSGYGLSNTGDFQNLIASAYWSGTEYSAYPGNAWLFNFGYGDQSAPNKGHRHYALAVRPGDVAAAAAAPVPEPGTMLLLGSGLVGLVLIRKKIVRRHG